MNSTVLPYFHFGMIRQCLAAARLTWPAYDDGRKRENSSAWKDRIIVASTCRRSMEFGCYVTWIWMANCVSAMTNITYSCLPTPVNEYRCMCVHALTATVCACTYSASMYVRAHTYSESVYTYMCMRTRKVRLCICVHTRTVRVYARGWLHVWGCIANIKQIRWLLFVWSDILCNFLSVWFEMLA